MPMRMKSPPFKALLPLLLALIAAAPPAPQLPPDFRAMCPYEAKLCADYDALKTELDAAAGQTLNGDQLAKLNGELIGIVRRTDAVVYDQVGKWKLDGIREIQGSIFGGLYVLRHKVNDLSLASAPAEATRLYGRLLSEEQRADKLIGDLQGSMLSAESLSGLAQSLDALNGEATGTWQEVRTFAFNADRMGYPIESTVKRELSPAGKLIDTHVNSLQERVANLRDRLAKIRQATGSSPSPQAAGEAAAAREASAKVGARLKAGGLDRDLFEHRAAEEAPVSGASPATAGKPGFDPNRVNLTVSPKMLLDNRPPPEIAKPTTPLPPRTFWQRMTGASPLYGGGVFTDRDAAGEKHTIAMDAFPAETERIANLRDAGRTTTVGDPGGRAQYVFRQTGGTCALASQAQMYAEAHGIKPTRANMRKLEDELFARASNTNQFTGNSADPGQRGTQGGFGGGGTQDQYLGNMLDTPVKKHYLAKQDELLTAVSRGKMVMVSANAGMLWNDERHKNGGHAIVITGAEVDQAGGLLGYYINDTGTGEGARFVSAKQFLPAWENRGSVFIEPL